MPEIYLTVLVLAVYDIYLMQPSGVNYLCREGHGEPGSVRALHNLEGCEELCSLSPLVEPALSQGSKGSVLNHARSNLGNRHAGELLLYFHVCCGCQLAFKL